MLRKEHPFGINLILLKNKTKEKKLEKWMLISQLKGKD